MEKKLTIYFDTHLFIIKILVLLLLLGLGVYFLSIQSFLYATLLFIFSLPILLFKGIQIDSLNQQIRFFSSFLGIKFGKWKPIPKLKYISVFSILEKTLCEESTNRYFYGKGYQVNLFDENEMHYTIFESDNRMKAIKFAYKINKTLNLEIHDKTK